MLCFLCFVFILQSISFNAFAAQKNELKGVRTWPSPDNTRIVLDLAQKPDYETHYLTHPDRLVVDLKTTNNKANLKKISNKGVLIKNIRESASGESGTFRLVVDLKKASKAKIFSLRPAKPYGHRLVIDLPTLVTKVPKSIAAVPNGRDIIIAVDAGHGGDDPGALGKYTYEKKVTLQIAKRLKTKIDAQKGMQSFLIRTGDYFVNLNKRSEIARKGKADFLVSIHADGFTSSQPRGASVWVLSNRRATTELGRWMEKHEAHSELLGGAGDIIQDSDSVPFLNKMLLDMSMGNTMGVGYTIGDLVTTELSKVTQMHKKKPVHASLAVLKSPDIPSILVEAGFITNRTEERLLNQAEFQNKIASAVYKGIYKHFNDKPPQGSLFAQKKRAIKHTVRSGESLSVLARRYSVTSNELKSFNHLKSNSLRIGQVLSIPPNYQVAANEPTSQQNAAPVRRKAQTHVVKRGESLSVIAAKYQQSTKTLAEYNQLRSTTLAIGQKINIPGDVQLSVASTTAVNAPKPMTQRVLQKEQLHQVKRGESLSVIASQYDKSIAQLMSYNKLQRSSLQVGQKIKIPGVYIEVAATATPSVQAPIVNTPEIHKVQRGESLSVIASQYNKSIAEIKDYNDLKTTTLFVGQQLKLSKQQKPVLAVAERKQSQQKNKVVKAQTHKVQRGESLSAIAQKYASTTAQLIQYNNLKSTSLLIGQKIKIPGNQQQITQRPDLIYRVKSGDSLSVIASQYDMSTKALKDYNQLRSSSLRVGQKIKVPGTMTTAAVKKVVVPTQHKVSSGESLSVIAEKYDRTSKQFEVYNNLSSSRLLVGQVLKIPGANYVAPSVPESHKVKSGESLSVIAYQYGTTSEQLKLHNKLRSSTLFVGQVLKIPTQKVQQTEHKVRSGESLSVIAQRYGTTTTAIKSTNNLRSNSLAVGQVLTIPIS
ncbi:LysM peptidoglycan-binding domain-containing protein [Vibrio sp. 2-Bac 85]